MHSAFVVTTLRAGLKWAFWYFAISRRKSWSGLVMAMLSRGVIATCSSEDYDCPEVTQRQSGLELDNATSKLNAGNGESTWHLPQD